MLRVRRALFEEFERLDRLCRQLARRDTVCRQLETSNYPRGLGRFVIR